jgi:hypothetical protein
MITQIPRGKMLGPNPGLLPVGFHGPRTPGRRYTPTSSARMAAGLGRVSRLDCLQQHPLYTSSISVLYSLL